VNEKFTFFLNNSNLLLTFVSDFEDYKSGDPNIPIGKSKCNECEDLYILTSDIFEKYFNRINIPYDIDVSEGNSKTNYKDKVLYFFDLKDLKKILNEHNLEKSSSDIAQLNKKRLLCKIISLSFIKLYIIVKSIYQTFNIYDSLIIEEKTEEPVIEPLPPIDPTLDPTLDPSLDPVQTNAIDPYGIPEPFQTQVRFIEHDFSILNQFNQENENNELDAFVNAIKEFESTTTAKLKNFMLENYPD
jgi:hypothetical protein